jgi:hypothetical protein
MKRYVLLCGLAVLALALPAQAITWDYVYDGDVMPTTVGWTEHGTDGTVSLGTEGSTNYLTFDTNGGAGKRYFEYGTNWNADFMNGVIVEFRARCHDDGETAGSMHAGFPAFSDGSYAYDMRFLCDTASGHYPGYWRIEGAARSYVPVGTVDLEQWNIYTIVCTDMDYEFYVNGTLTKTAAIGDVSAGTGAQCTTNNIWIGDYIASAPNDIICDLDWIRFGMDQVPEPATMGLLLAGAGFLVRRRRR